MKNKNFHLFPLQTTFLKKIQAGVQYYNENHYINFDVSSLEIVTFTAFPGDEYWPIDLIFEKALRTLSIHNSKYLTKLKISIQGSSLFKTSTLRHFGLSLSHHFKTLKQLDLRFLSCNNLDRGNLRHLLDSLTKGMECLTEVNIYFLGSSDIGDQGLEDLKSSILKQCKRWQRLKVVIDGFILNPWDRGLAYFEPSLDERLQNNNIIAQCENEGSRNEITSKGGKSFCRGIGRYLQKLRSFTFKMTTCRDEEDIKLTKVIFKMIACLENLEDLNFSAPDFLAVDDEYLAELVSTIGKKMKKLRSLSLDFPIETMISERGYQQLTQNLFSSLPPDLIYFALNLETCPSVTDEIVRKIGLGIAKNLKNLRTLILSFCSMDQLTSNAPSQLTQIISQGLLSLKKLTLSFDWCRGINQNFSIVLPEQVQKFDMYLTHQQLMIHKTWENLNRLSLNFGKCKEDKSLVDLFSESSFALRDLNELKLMYSQCTEISDEQIQRLASAIGTKQKNLVSLELGFSECQLLTSSSLLVLSAHICKQLEKLRHLNLTFTNSDYDLKSPSFTEVAITYLTSVITSRLENLESLTLNFHNSVDKGANMKELLALLCFAISENLKKLKKLSLMFSLDENPELKHQIREKLYRIPMLYIY